MRRLLALLFVAATMLLAGCKETLFDKLGEREANEVLAALAEARIDASKTRLDEGMWQIQVDDARVGAALVFLRNRGLPSRQGTNLGEVFKKEGMISSQMEERARYAYALQEDIAATLRRIDDVVDARVHVALPHNDPLAQRSVPVSAAVFIKHRQSLDFEMLSPSIKSLVMASVEGLDYRNIALVAVAVDREAVVEPPVRRTGWMDAQAATATQAQTQTQTLTAGSDMTGAAVLGLLASSVLAWWSRQRARARGHHDLPAVATVAPRAAPAPSPRLRAEPLPAPDRSVVKTAAAPSSRPGLFDSTPVQGAQRHVRRPD
jgi:type III secretion protein J